MVLPSRPGPGRWVPCLADARGLSRHTFLCGQSGSGKTYSLGVILERLLIETDLRVVVLDPNSDFVRLDQVRSDADPVLAGRYHQAANAVAVYSAHAGGDRRLRLHAAEVDPAAQGGAAGKQPESGLTAVAVAGLPARRHLAAGCPQGCPAGKNRRLMA